VRRELHLPDLIEKARTMRLYTMDAWVSDPAVLTDEAELKAALRAGARVGGATVIGEEFCVFPNRAVTGVLVLAQSHLSIHTWPELALANVDLLTYGEISGRDVLAEIRLRLSVTRASITCIPRAVG
jgi:S-adenosylmethionine decarboxylase